MADNEALSSAEKLKQYFSSRVITQTRQLIELWNELPSQKWSQPSLDAIIQSAERLMAFAKRFEAEKHLVLAYGLLRTLSTLEPGVAPNSEQLARLNQTIQALSQTDLRHSDDKTNGIPNFDNKPIYLALAESKHTQFMLEQMRYFRLRPEAFITPETLQEALQMRHPAALIIDIDFGGKEQGLDLVKELQQSREATLPIIFTYTQQAPSLEQRLRILRKGGVAIHQETDVHTIIGEVEGLLDNTPDAPYKILVIDDSKSQSLYTANTLNKAGMLCEAVNDPLQVLDKLNSYTPDLILMDMYMPHCTGMELARVIRQQPQFINLPIIYLSGEEDKAKQLEAMAEGGDDFLTKPVDSEHLLTTIRNRVLRARQLQDLISRDSLTGLLNHTHILGALDNSLKEKKHLPITFVMVDIDHFKQVNDLHGHPVGDHVIRNLALFLKQHVRKTDPIGRYGGEEFAIVLHDASEEQAKKIMNSIREGFAKLAHSNNGLKATFSCGLAQWQGQSASELVALADRALYQSKHNGRNQVTGASELTYSASN